MKGLEISELTLNEVLNRNDIWRWDSEYFQKDNIHRISLLDAVQSQALGEIAFVTDGIHASIDFCEGSGIRLYSAKHPKLGFCDVGDVEEINAKQHKSNPRTALGSSDILISTVGTIGNACIVEPWMLPANADRHVGIIRAKSVDSHFLLAFLISDFGRFQSNRESTGNVQQSLFISKLINFRVPVFPKRLETAISQLVSRALSANQDAARLLLNAEDMLLRDLHLDDWQPPEPLTYTRRASDVFAAGRMDADYFAPRVDGLLKRLSRGGQTVGDVAPARREKFKSAGVDEFDYIEISDVQSDGTVASSRMAGREAPSRATWHVHAGDVLTSTVRPIRRLSALVTPEQDGFVCSSGFVVLQPRRVAPEVCLTYLRLPLVCELMDLHTSASLYPAISDTDLLTLPFPEIDEPACVRIVDAVRSAHAARRCAHALLERAKRAVEIAIEESEAVALRFLAEPLEGITT